MHTLFEQGDGTGREFREAQQYVLDRLRAVWHDNKPIVILGQTGLGKSMLARTIQLESDGAIVTPQNTLIKQYLQDYPELNHWWGKNHFTCHSHDMHTADCEYTLNRKAAIENTKHTIFNPMSLYYLRRGKGMAMKPHSTVIIDEAHAVLSMLRGLSTQEFDMQDVPAPHKLEVTYNLRAWVQERYDHAKDMYDAYMAGNDAARAATWARRMRRYSNLMYGLEYKGEQYAIKYDRAREKLNVTCTRLPPHIAENTFGPGRKILLSGTIFRPDISELLNTEDYHLIEPPSTIPVENRKIHFKPTPFRINYQTDRGALAQFINMYLERYGRGERAIVHLPYSWAREVSEHLNRPNAIFHDKEGKDMALLKFKRTPGSVLLACGMAEGVDLPGDLCRLNIIPKILWPSMFDEFVQKRSAQADGQLWYALEAGKTVIQQAGRSTRGPDDWSRTVVMDTSFVNLIEKTKNHLPHSFLEAIVWSRD